MEKVMYVLRGALDAATGDRLRGQLLEWAGETPGAAAVLVHDADAAAAPSPAPAPAGEAVHAGIVSVWVDCYQRRPSLAIDGYDTAEYLVVESVYDDYDTVPGDGERSPGVLTVATLNRPANLDEAQWLHNWHEVQSPESGRLQPRTRYVRNRVVQHLTPDAPRIDGIVEEGWASAEVVADPMLFFETGGDPAKLGPMVEEMMVNVVACLDLDRLRSTTMSEYLL
jgi:hypothetical protein